MRTKILARQGVELDRGSESVLELRERSEGFATWKAPAAMNRNVVGAHDPYLVVTAEPSRWGAGPAGRPRARHRGRGPLAPGDLVELSRK